METLTEEDDQERSQASLIESEEICNYNGFDWVARSHDDCMNSSAWFIQLRPGLALGFWQSIFYRDLAVEKYHDDLMPLTSHFYLSGTHRVLSPGIQEVPDEYIEQVGQHYLFYLPTIDEIEQWFAGNRLQMVNISFDLELFRTYHTGTEILPEPLRALIEHNIPPRFYRAVGAITPAMFTVLQHILKPPFEGMMMRMFLEGKVLELLALQLNQFIEQEKLIRPLINLKSAEIEQVYQAREWLVLHQAYPPLLIDLANEVGLSERKLQKGFRELFGTTVFGYLHDHRMEQARVLLSSGEQWVSEVAHAVGYAHLGHFTKAFKRKFGITPKECQMGRKPTL